MYNRRDLPHSQLYYSRYVPVQTSGNYNKALEEFNRLRSQKQEEKKRRREEEKSRRNELDVYQGRVSRAITCLSQHYFSKFGEDWIFLAALGIFMAIISYILDKGVTMCTQARMWLYNDLAYNYFAKWVAWIALPVCLILFDTGFTHLVGPQAKGSGLAQIKTMLRGVELKEFLTFRVLLAKWVGITSTMGSGMPLGKEGPLIHIASIIVTKMSHVMSSFRGVYQTEGKSLELLGAAWAVGVACTFNAPIGGVLFSVEITTAYYAVRNYWRGFFAAVWGATTYRLLSVWIDGFGTIVPVFKTSFFVDFPYDPQELFAFAILGLICGLGGSLYIWCKMTFNSWLKNNYSINHMRKCNVFLYPLIVVLIISTVMWPPGIGQFINAATPGGGQVVQLFSNFTWTNTNLTIVQNDVVSKWITPYTGIYANLFCFIGFQCFGSILSSTMPIPCGSFIPNFRAGAAIGRITGELMHTWFPLGVTYKGKIIKILPGAYATVGAAAFSGAVTHTMSVCVILFEMTSQITHVIPVLIAVLISNGIARMLTPSIYDLGIMAGKLPYLPDLLPNSSAIYSVSVEDFMIRDVKYVFLGMTYRELKNVLKDNIKIGCFPLVSDKTNMTLLGSISREQLITLIEHQIGRRRRYEILPSAIIDRSKEFEKEGKNDSEKTQEQVEEKKKESPPLRNDIEYVEEETTERTKIFRKYEIDKRKIQITSKGKPREVHVPILRVIDMSPEDQKQWEIEQLQHEADFALCDVDPAPFQLVEMTSLLKVHSLFSMLAIKYSCVTTMGRLVGVVGLPELRKAIEDANSGNLPTRTIKPDSSLPLLPKKE